MKNKKKLIIQAVYSFIGASELVILIFPGQKFILPVLETVLKTRLE